MIKNIFYFLLFLSVIFLPASSLAQTGPAIQWQNTIGGNSIDVLTSILQTNDGGYILGGRSVSDSSGDKTESCIGNMDYWIIKTDSSGNIQWQNNIGGSDVDFLNCIQQTNDGGYIMGGKSHSTISGDKTEICIGISDYWIVKTNSVGNIQWQNTIGGSDNDILTSMQQTIDGGYILGGWSSSNISGDKTENTNGGYDYWIVKTDSLGSIQWQNSIGGGNNDNLSFMQQTTDKGYILAGSSQSNISGDKTENSNGSWDYWIVKTDTLGNIQWQKTIGGNNADYLTSIQQIADGGYILGGYSLSNISGDKTENCIGQEDYWVIKSDSAGNMQWQNTIGGNDEDILTSILYTSNGGYLLGGFSVSNISGDKTKNSYGAQDYWIIKTDLAGNILWQNTIGGNFFDALYNMKQTNDNGYILGGSSESDVSGDKTENSNGYEDYWIIKLAPDTITSTTNFQFPISTIQITPNPAKDNITLQLPNYLNYPLTISITSIFGQSIYTSTVSNTTKQVIIPVSHYPGGMYIAKVTSGEKIYTSKFVVQ